MRRIMTVKAVFLIGAYLSLLIACNENTPSPTVVSAGVTSSIESTSLPATATPSHIPDATPTFTVTVDVAAQAMRHTAEAADRTAVAFQQQAMDAQATKVAQFPPACDEDIASENLVSPNDEWLAAGCADKSDLRMAVVNKEGKKWELKLKNFIHPDSLIDGEPPLGSLYPKIWSPDGVYLYFSRRSDIPGVEINAFLDSMVIMGCFGSTLKMVPG